MQKRVNRAIGCLVSMIIGLTLACGEKPKPPPTEEPAPQPEERPVQETVTFKSQDGLEVTADSNVSHETTAPFIVLFHQARWSRGEYAEIAPKLAALGFNTMAVDQRSGGEVNGVENETHKRAKAAGKPVEYLDAYPDMVAALEYAKANHAKGKTIVWGSSYSSALVFRLAAEHPDEVDGLLSFAPGEYYEDVTGDPKYIEGFAGKVKCPVFVTSAKEEGPNWKGIFEAVSGNKTSYLPDTEGKHGSSALWEKQPDNAGYWKAVEAFLKEHF